jgi:hypothetical protein
MNGGSPFIKIADRVEVTVALKAMRLSALETENVVLGGSRSCSKSLRHTVT